MSHIIIFHGTGATPDVCWYPWLSAALRTEGHTIEVPYYPDLNKTPIHDFLPQVLSNHTVNTDTILIGHSGGAPLVLSVLENIEAVVPKAFLVAGYSTPPNDSEEPILQPSYNWERIQGHVQDIYFINSTNDPYGCDDAQGRQMFDKLGGRLIITNEGHFGSEFQDCPEFDLLKRLI